jgi:hypothetical protein
VILKPLINRTQEGIVCQYTRKFPRGKRNRIIKDPPGVATLQSKIPRVAVEATPKSQKLLKRSRAVEATDYSVQLRDPMVYQANATINRPLCCRGSAFEGTSVKQQPQIGLDKEGILFYCLFNKRSQEFKLA